MTEMVTSDEPDMTAAEFRARQRAGIPVEVVTTRDDYEASLRHEADGIRLTPSKITVSQNGVVPGMEVSGASKL